MNFKQLPNGMCDGFVILKKCDVKKTKTGSEYLDAVIADKDGEMNAKLWDFKGDANTFEPDMVVKIRGNIETYNGKNQFRIAQIRPTGEGDVYDMCDLVPASEVSGEQLFEMIKQRVNAFKNEDLKRIVTTIIDEKKEKLITYPAALRLHHAMLGGLMYHTMSIIRLAESVCNIYPNVNKDLLLSGVILHDVAKTWELEASKTGLAKGYTVEGELIGHLVKGAIFVNDTAKKLSIDSEVVTLLEHMILSHHGIPDYGAAVRPMFLEAEILSMQHQKLTRVNLLTDSGHLTTANFIITDFQAQITV
jgi:3'-5' exoribonuclease